LRFRAWPDPVALEAWRLLDRGEPTVERELMQALRDEVVLEAALKISHLSGKERHLVLGIVRQFGRPDE
jgi:hypothetical protein